MKRSVISAGLGTAGLITGFATEAGHGYATMGAFTFAGVALGSAIDRDETPSSRLLLRMGAAVVGTWAGVEISLNGVRHGSLTEFRLGQTVATAAATELALDTVELFDRAINHRPAGKSAPQNYVR